uniref:Uncharacterized protein n=1 Tax=Leersia perrieri TaxID=77586 RepID=A0A0D9W2E4_9ORYZ
MEQLRQNIVNDIEHIMKPDGANGSVHGHEHDETDAVAATREQREEQERRNCADAHARRPYGLGRGLSRNLTTKKRKASTSSRLTAAQAESKKKRKKKTVIEESTPDVELTSSDDAMDAVDTAAAQIPEDDDTYNANVSPGLQSSSQATHRTPLRTSSSAPQSPFQQPRQESPSAQPTPHQQPSS